MNCFRFLAALVLVTYLMLQVVRCNISSPIIVEGEYKNSFIVDDKTQLFWALNSTMQTLEIAVRATNVTGYVAMAFNYKDNIGMRDADCALGTVSTDGSIVVIDGYLRDIAEAFADTTLGGTSNILAYTGSYQDFVLTYKFIRRLSATDSFDTTIVNGSTLIAMSFGIAMTPFTPHSRNLKGIDINFFEDSNPASFALPYTLFRFDLVVAAALILLNCIIGIFVTYVQILHPTYLGNLMFHRKLLGYLPSLSTNPYKRFLLWCLEPLFNLLYLTPGELWIVVNYILVSGVWFGYGFGNAFTERVDRVTDISPWARGFGRLNILNLSFIMLPAARYSIWYLIFGISFDRAIKFHKWLGYFNFLIITAHGLLMIIDYKVTAFTWIIEGYRWNLAGFIAWVFFLFMFLFTFSKIRRLTFEFFLLTHYVFGLPALVFSVLHCKVVDLLPYMAVSILLYLADMLLRFIVGFLFPTKLVSMEYNEKAKVTKITLEKFKGMFLPRAGQFIYLWINRLLPFEQHPFTISSVVETDNKWMVRFTLHIRNEGKYKYTGLLANLAQKIQQGKVSKKYIIVRAEGPYGSLQCEPSNFHTIVLASGGIGITPMLAMVRSLSKKIDQGKMRKLKTIIFVWSVREEPMLQLILSELPLSSSIQYHIHWTGYKKPIALPTIASTETAHLPAAITIGQDPPPKTEPSVSITEVISSSTPATNSLIPIQHGRVDLNALLKQVREKSLEQGFHFAGLYICGPDAFIRTAQQSAWKQSSIRFQFQVHVETFRL